MMGEQRIQLACCCGGTFAMNDATGTSLVSTSTAWLDRHQECRAGHFAVLAAAANRSGAPLSPAELANAKLALVPSPPKEPKP